MGTSTRMPVHIRPGVPAENVANRVAVTTAPALARLLALPKWFLPLTCAVLLLAGLTLGGIVGLLLLWTLAGGLGWLLAAFWPVTPTGGRVLRVAVVLGVAVLGVLKLR